MLPNLRNSPSAQKSNYNNNHNNNKNNGSSLKRSSSMIFRIEHLLPSSSSSSKASTITMESKQKVAVIVAQFTNKGTVSECLSTDTLMSTSCTNALEEGEQRQRVVCNLSQGLLSITPRMLRQIRLAEDIHSYNALLEMHKGQVRLRVTQDLNENDEIIAWFSEQMSILMSIPFLTLANIKGDKLYSCHMCQQNFETPHPLKLHLALDCDQNSKDILFIRLYYAVNFNQQQQILNTVSNTSTIPITTPSIMPAFIKSEPRYSAFKPIKTTASDFVATTTSSVCVLSPLESITTSSQHHTPPTLVSHGSTAFAFMPQINMDLTASTTNSLNAAAQIEAIVSNMGASRRGHLCLYCGKCYSRKYGLKIHIRTHTGFKPLKCKFCLRPFGDPSNLNKHVRLHLQSNTINVRNEVHKCHICHKALARRRDLQRHLESRHSVDIKQNS